MNIKNSVFTAVTGNIATGKSFISEILRDSYGFEIINADHIGHEILKKNEVKSAVEKEFGSCVFSKNGELDRGKLGDAVFSNESNRLFINKLTHPLIIKEAVFRIEKMLSKGKKVVFEAAVLFEANWHEKLSPVILTTCAPEEQKKRLTEIRKTSSRKSDAIIKAQMPQEKKIPLADYVIDTSFGPESFKYHLDMIVRDIIKRSTF